MSRFREYHQSKGTRSSTPKQGVSLEGFDDFLKMVKKLPENMKSNTMAAIMRKNMQPIANAIKAKAPTRYGKEKYQKGAIRKINRDGKVSTTSTPGNLKRSIGVRTFKDKWGNISAYAGIQNGKKIEGMEGRFGDGWYGFFHERGSKTVAKKPFIAPAAAATVPLAKEKLQDEIKEYIVKNAKRLGLDAK